MPRDAGRSAPRPRRERCPPGCLAAGGPSIPGLPEIPGAPGGDSGSSPIQPLCDAGLPQAICDAVGGGLPSIPGIPGLPELPLPVPTA